MMEWILLGLIVYIAVQDILNRRERNRLMEAFLAKNLEELREPVKKGKEIEAMIEKQPDHIPLDLATADEFDKAIRKTVGKETKKDKAEALVKKVVKRGR